MHFSGCLSGANIEISCFDSITAVAISIQLVATEKIFSEEICLLNINMLAFHWPNFVN